MTQKESNKKSSENSFSGKKKTHKTSSPKKWCLCKKPLVYLSNVVQTFQCSKRLGSPHFQLVPQHERMARKPPQQHPGPRQVPGSFRSAGDMLFVKFGSFFPRVPRLKKKKTFELPPPWWLVNRNPGLEYGFHPPNNRVGFHPLYIS